MQRWLPHVLHWHGHTTPAGWSSDDILQVPLCMSQTLCTRSDALSHLRLAIRQSRSQLLLQLRPQAIDPLVDSILQAVHLIAVSSLQGHIAGV